MIPQQENNNWSSEKIVKYLEILDNGGKVKGSPFKENNIMYRKGNINFDYTKEEIRELVKCKKDIIYFANNYCHVKTKEGIRQVKIRDYQEDILRAYQKNQFNVFLAARQSGKCVAFDTHIDALHKVQIGKLYFEKLKELRKLNIFEKLKYKIYKYICEVL